LIHQAQRGLIARLGHLHWAAMAAGIALFQGFGNRIVDTFELDEL